MGRRGEMSGVIAVYKIVPFAGRVVGEREKGRGLCVLGGGGGAERPSPCRRRHGCCCSFSRHVRKPANASPRKSENSVLPLPSLRRVQCKRCGVGQFSFLS